MSKAIRASVGHRANVNASVRGRFTRALTLACLATLTTISPATGANPVDCPNEAIREAQTSEALPLGTVEYPHCMALEMVSPPKKFAQGAIEPMFAQEGGRIRFNSRAALVDTPGLQDVLIGDSYIATRGQDGWASAATSPPSVVAIVVGGDRQGGPAFFSADLRRWVSVGATVAQANAGSAQLFSGGLDGAFAPLSPLLVPIDDSGDSDLVLNASNMPLIGASADLSTAVFRAQGTFASTSYLFGDPRTNEASEPGGNQNNYLAFLDEKGEPSIQLLARDLDDEVYGGRCGTHLGGGAGGIDQGAISADGSRIYFSTRPGQPFDEEKADGPVCDLANPLRIMKRTATPTGPVIEELVPAGPPAGDDLYQGASLDGTKVYFTTSRAVATSDQDAGPQCGRTPGASVGCDLYLYDSTLPEGSRVVQVSAGEPGSPTPGQGADVLSPITAISGDGSHAYFVAEGVLTSEPNPEGDVAVAGEPNLYVHEGGSTSFIGTLVDGDEGSGGSGLWGVGQSFAGDAAAVPYLGESPEDGGDGHVLVFGTRAALASGDADEKVDVYRYDSEAETLEQISVAASGGSQEPAADASMNPKNFLESRWVSEDGSSIGFSTAEPLVSGDEDEAANPYLWKEGELLRLPSVVVGQDPTVSPSGESVAFTATGALLPLDGDTAEDVYVARVEGGFPNPTPSAVCDPLQEGSCQGSAATPPAISAPATATFSGPGNQKKPASCRKARVRRQGRCVKPKKRSGKGAGKRANRKQGESR